MKKTLYFFVLMLFLNLGDSTAQEENYNSLSLNWGYGNLMRQDLNFSKMIHNDWSPINFLIAYDRSKKLEQQAVLKFSNYKPIVGEQFDFYYYDGKMETALPHSMHIADINYALGKKILKKNRWDLVVGGKLQNRFMASDYIFGNASSFSYYFSFGLNVWSKIEFELNQKHRFITNIALPLFAYATRSPYLSVDDQYLVDNYDHKALKAVGNFIKRGDFQSWGSSQSFDFDLTYYYALSEKWDIGLKYLLSMNFTQTPTSFTSIENVFYLSANLKF